MCTIVESDNTNRRIYLDYASTTPVDKDVLTYMLPYFHHSYSNPSSMHSSGRKAEAVIQRAKREIADILKANEEEIIFTGSGTESDNLAILGICRAYKHRGNHLIISAIEHKAVIEPAKQLEKEGFRVSILKVDKRGKINIHECMKLVTPQTILLSVMYANNEIGTIQPIKELAEQIALIKNSEGLPFLHTDACQATGYLPIDTSSLGVDLMTLNSSKIYGPKGVGLLYKKIHINLDPIITGGDQEYSKRAGTENIALIAGFAHALKKAENNRIEESARLKKLQRTFMINLKNKIPFLKFNGHVIDRLPHNVHISIPAIEGESMLLLLDQEGIEVATGSACSALDLKPSHVLLAIGQDPEIIHGSIRFSFGKYTTEKELDITAEIFLKVVNHLISLSCLKI
jgi:cysteine desulfurase